MPHTLLADFPLVISLPVQWGDMDGLGHVNNIWPIRWFESSRVAYLDQTGLRDLMAAQRIGPILVSVQCNYRRQIVYPDTVHVGARISRMGRTSLTIVHALASERLQEIAADGESVVVMFDYDRQRPVPIPQEFLTASERFQGTIPRQ